jgi:hypothetical protein
MQEKIFKKDNYIRKMAKWGLNSSSQEIKIILDFKIILEND